MNSAGRCFCKIADVQVSSVDAMVKQSHRRHENANPHNPSLRSVFAIHASQLVIANKRPTLVPPYAHQS